MLLPTSALALALLSATPFSASIRDEPGWVEAERGILENHVQLTSEAHFRKAGECYFSPDGTQIIFQAVEQAEDIRDEEPFYQMYVADLVFEGDAESGRVAGIDHVVRLTPPRSSSTCGWFHPTEPGVVVFGCTIVPPSDPSRVGYQRESKRYSWQFPKEMDIVRCDLATADGSGSNLERVIADPEAYLAECVIRHDGRYMVYCQHRISEGASGGDLLIRDLLTGRDIPAAATAGYDGGPFFSPDGKRLCYRSDRRGDDLLQVFVSELAFDHAGNLLGVEREFQVTDNDHVNWAPYWHPNGRALVYATSEVGHDNYEVYWVDADPGTDGGPTKYGTRKRRITFAPKFDGLPVFNGEGTRMMWTSQRGADKSSQVWIADFMLPVDGSAPQVAVTEAPSGSDDTERLQVQDPDTGFYYLYDKATHALEVYDPKTHAVRAATGDEAKRAMALFRERR